MISDSERREIAAILRGLDERIDGVPLMCTEQEHDAMVLSAIRSIIGDGDVFHRLADLIDRPTCKNINEHYDVFECSECHCKVEVMGECMSEYGGIFYAPFLPSYCPSCGAEAV